MASVPGGLVSIPLLLVILVSCNGLKASSLRRSRKSEKLFPADCGGRPYFESVGRRTKRLVNGNYSAFGQYPWQVAIDVKKVTVCSGSLINSEWVLTSAFCVSSRSTYSITLRFGEWDKWATNEPLKDVNATVEKKILYPRFDIENLYTDGYDIALLKLQRPIQFQPHIQPICLPEMWDDLKITGQMAKLAGWGKIFAEDESSSILQEVALPIVDIETCKRLFAYNRKEGPSLHDALCAGYIHGKISVCSQDSVGGLQLQRKDGKWILIGFMSWTQTCAERNSIVFFTRVSSYIPWIRRILMLEATP